MLKARTDLHSYSELSIDSVPKGLTLFVSLKIREIRDKITTVTLSHVSRPIRFANK